ncbi:helix-turn-helix domain-containing protein [Pseudovibrio denitrificans]|uniref:helix-turn-helix domain-containing protein n=1 Tax=Pseudovibrio denitrificans TaxID=258256 RepID=UPI0039BEEDBD
MSERRPFRDVKLQWLKLLSNDVDLSDNAKVVAFYLITTHFLKDAEEAWPSFQFIANNLGKSIKTIQRAIRDLEIRGWFDVERGSYRAKSTQYRPTEKSILAACEEREKTDKVVTLRTKKGGQNCLERRSNLSSKGGQQCPPKKEIEKNNKTRPREDAPPCLNRRQAIPALFIKRNEHWKLNQWHSWLEQHALPALAELDIAATRNGVQGYILPSNCPPSPEDTKRTQDILHHIQARLNRPAQVISYPERLAS